MTKPYPKFIIYKSYPDYSFGVHLLELVDKDNGIYISRASGEYEDIVRLKELLEKT